MCGRFVMLTAAEVADVVAAVERRGRLRALDEGIARMQAVPTSLVQTIALSGNDLAVAERTWGFSPEWSKKPIFNTRIEKAGERGMWERAFREGRCVIPAAAFFEPHMSETIPSPRTGRPTKRAYAFSSPNGEPLLFAGLRDDACCSIVTCEPNRWVAPVHNRMPLLLRFEEVGAWLNAEYDVRARTADAEAFALDVRPEHPEIAPDDEQLSLF